MGFKRIRSIRLSESQQGELYYHLKRYRELPAREKQMICELCDRCAKQHAEALLEWVTSYKTVVSISDKYFVSQTQLYEYRKRLYEAWYGQGKADSTSARGGAPVRDGN